METDRLKELLESCEIGRLRGTEMEAILADALKALVLCREALEVAADAFDEIRGDWSDPRNECRRGRNACDEALCVIAKVGEGGGEGGSDE